MNSFLLLASAVALLLGLGHSALGEILIFRRLKRLEYSVHSDPLQLSKRHWAALRTTWHLASLLGWGFAVILFLMSMPETSRSHQHWLVLLITVIFLIAALYWVLGTRGKHPGWIPMVIIALLVWWS